MKEFSESNAHPKFKISKKKGLFDNVKALFPFLVEKKNVESKLAGRIHAELKKDAHAILDQMKALKENLKKELDNQEDSSHLWACFETVINPLIREFSQIDKKLTDSTDSDHIVIKNYEEWIVKAKMWVSLCSKPSDRISIIEAVIEHYLHISDDIIDRDLKTLNDYKQYELYNLGLDFEEIKAASQRLDSQLETYVQALLDLKHKKPQDLELHHLTLWKAKLDEDRANLYHTALHTIDEIIREIAPNSMTSQDLPPLDDLHKRLLYVEDEMPIFLGHLSRVDLRDDVKRQLLESQLAFLEDEIHKINQDLRLPPDLIDRVDLIIKQLENSRRLFNS
jgi:hypothetical protein